MSIEEIMTWERSEEWLAVMHALNIFQMDTTEIEDLGSDVSGRLSHRFSIRSIMSDAPIPGFTKLKRAKIDLLCTEHYLTLNLYEVLHDPVAHQLLWWSPGFFGVEAAHETADMLHNWMIGKGYELVDA